MAKNILKEEYVDFEKGFLIRSSLAAVLISVVGLIINVAISLGTAMYIIPIVSMFIYTALFFMAKSFKNVIFVKWIFVIITMFFLNTLWVFNYGSHGPAPYFFILIYTLLIFVFSSLQLWIITVVLALNITVFFFLDLFYPGITNNYDSDTKRIVDVYTGIVIYAFIIFGLVTNAKNHFIKEYRLAKTSDNVKTNFLNNISHEIRTPLNAIVGFSSILSLDGVSDNDRDEYLQAINESTDSLLKIVTEILDVSQIEAGGIELNPENIIINDVLSSIKLATEKSLKEKAKSHIIVKLNIPDKSSLIDFDKTRFEQIFNILISNSIKFSSRGAIEMGYEVKYSKFLFWVKDDGIGIKDEFKDKVFKSFTRNEKSTSGRFGGTGIGLFLARSLVKLNGGEIWFESVYKEGSTFYFSIPRNTMMANLLKPE